MTKGSTSTLKFILPFNTSLLKEVNIIVKDYKHPKMYTVIRHLSDCEVGEKTLRTTISAEEMMNFDENHKVKIQLQCTFTDGQKQNSVVFYRDIKELLDEEVV